MQVKDRLSGVRIRVDDGAIAAIRDAFRLGDPRGHEVHTPDTGGILGLVERRNVIAWNHEDMNGRLRVDITEREAILVLGDDRRWYFLPDDATKQAIGDHVRRSAVMIVPREQPRLRR